MSWQIKMSVCLKMCSHTACHVFFQIWGREVDQWHKSQTCFVLDAQRWNLYECGFQRIQMSFTRMLELPLNQHSAITMVRQAWTCLASSPIPAHHTVVTHTWLLQQSITSMWRQLLLWEWAISSNLGLIQNQLGGLYYEAFNIPVVKGPMTWTLDAFI